MRRKWKIGLLLGGVAAGIVACCLWPSQEPAYEGKRLSKWLDEGHRLSLDDPYFTNPSRSTNPSVQRVVKAVQAIGTNAIPFLLRDMVRTHDSWVEHVKIRAVRLKLMDYRHMWAYPLNRAVWGFQALGTNGAPALEGLLSIYDGEMIRVGSAGAALSALGPFAVPELEKRLRAADYRNKCQAVYNLAEIGPAAEPAIPTLLPMLDETDPCLRQNAVLALAAINRQPERFVPLFRSLLSDSNGAVRAYAAGGLRRFGLSAKEAVPDLLRAASDPDSDVSDSARQALEAIESESLKAVRR